MPSAAGRSRPLVGIRKTSISLLLRARRDDRQRGLLRNGEQPRGHPRPHQGGRGEPSPLPLAARANGGRTVCDLAEPLLAEHVEVRLKPRTRQGVGGALRKQILPALDGMPVAAPERRYAVDLQQSMRAYPVTVNRTLKVLWHMYRLAHDSIYQTRSGSHLDRERVACDHSAVKAERVTHAR